MGFFYFQKEVQGCEFSTSYVSPKTVGSCVVCSNRVWYWLGSCTRCWDLVLVSSTALLYLVSVIRLYGQDLDIIAIFMLNYASLTWSCVRHSMEPWYSDSVTSCPPSKSTPFSSIFASGDVHVNWASQHEFET
ncbi:Calmodulin-binding transcription activator 2 [Zea mays]|uniref:Calmodulin-binding transcription activator 2 n=1 Tax=Zea mays TaxID=4577 RepID=A0A1D6PUF7_MAIZE|nr:Calmodulin-binding transcription activator 2 [Zea mays]AQK50283.1 Calmodulin-binding transcription activator 2 [Zea mays]AQK50291.1 Calmodulin-binding transcription activator 2 [Zea mays]